MKNKQFILWVKDNSSNKAPTILKNNRDLVRLLLDSRKHHFLDENELQQWNKIFLDHFSQTRHNVCPISLAHKTNESYVVIWIPLKHLTKSIWRAILIPNKYAEWSLFEDPETPIVEWVHLIEAANQLGSVIIEEMSILFKVAKFVGLQNRFLTKSLMKSEKHWSIEISNIQVSNLPWKTILGSYRITIYKNNEIIWWWDFIFSIEEYNEDMVAKDLRSNNEYKIKRAEKFRKTNLFIE